MSQGEGYVVRGKKWWSSGAMDPRCTMAIVMGRVVDPHHTPNPTEGILPTSSSSGAGVGADVGAGGRAHDAQTMLLVPMASKGVTVVRHLSVFGYDDAPHGHADVLLDGVEVGAEALLMGEGRGFEIAQRRLGPGRVHHCMRMVGIAERCLQLAGGVAPLVAI